MNYNADEIIELIQKRIEELKILYDKADDHNEALQIYGGINELEMIIAMATT